MIVSVVDYTIDITSYGLCSKTIAANPGPLAHARVINRNRNRILHEYGDLRIHALSRACVAFLSLSLEEGLVTG